MTITSASGTSSANLQGDKGAAGYTPQKGVDYWTDNDQEAIVQDVVARSEFVKTNQGGANVGKILVVGADGNLTLTDMPTLLSGDVVGMIDENNNIVITGDLADGTYTFKYANTDGTYADIGSLTVGSSGPAYTNIIDAVGYIDGKYASANASGDDAATTLTGWFPYAVAKGAASAPTIYIKGVNLNAATATAFSHERIQTRETASSTTVDTFYSGAPTIQSKFTITTLGEKYYKLVPVVENGVVSIASVHAISHMRMSLQGSGADLIITLDEPIE